MSLFSGGPRRSVVVVLVVLLVVSCGDDPPPPAEGLPRTLRGMIVFANDRGGAFELRAMRPDGTGLVSIPTPGTVAADDPAVSPDGRRLAFTGRSEEGTSHVYVMEVRTAAPTIVSRELPDQRPDWAPDGERVVFEAFTGTFDLAVTDAMGRGVDFLLEGPADEGAPAWSPDGRAIAYVSDEDGDADIYALDLASGDVRRITDEPGDELFPSWSPDGSTIAFEWDGDIAVVDAGGGEARLLAAHPARDTDPVWSPDGSRIAFESTREGGETSDIFVMLPDGTGLLRLTHDDADDEDPAWA